MVIEVVDATLRDMSFVLYNLNPADEEETACQIDPGLRRDHLAYMLLMSGDSFAVRIDGQPVAVFGTHRSTGRRSASGRWAPSACARCCRRSPAT